jgi:hypothetical protein
MILTRETEILGEKQCTASVMEEMNEYGALVE